METPEVKEDKPPSLNRNDVIHNETHLVSEKCKLEMERILVKHFGEEKGKEMLNEILK